jgi:CBS domain-containing protein
MANSDPPTNFGPANGLDRPGDPTRAGVQPPVSTGASRSVAGTASTGIGQAHGQGHEETAGEKLGRFFRRAMDRLGGNEPEWRREETGRPSSSSRGSWAPVSPALRIPPQGSEPYRRSEASSGMPGRNSAAGRGVGGQGQGQDGNGPQWRGSSSRRPGELGQQAARLEHAGERRFDPDERGAGTSWQDDDRTRRLARERENWNEWDERSSGAGTDWRESYLEAADRRTWQREPLVARDVMTRNPRAVPRGGTLRDAAVIMREENCGVVPVLDLAGRLQGILTDRDIVVRGITDDLRSSKVEDVMTDEVSAVTEDEPLTSVLELMGRRQIRRVPVVDRNDRLLGIISMADIATRADYDEDLQDAFLRISSRRSFWSLFT